MTNPWFQNVCSENEFTYIDSLDQISGDGRTTVVLLEDLGRGDGGDQSKQHSSRQHFFAGTIHN